MDNKIGATFMTWGNEAGISSDDEIVISLGTKTFDKVKRFVSPKLRLWLKKEDGAYEQIGFIHALKLKAKSSDLSFSFEITFPKKLGPCGKESVARYVKKLSKYGIEIKRA